MDSATSNRKSILFLPIEMQLVYFLLLPSALFSIQLRHFAEIDDSSLGQTVFQIEWQAVLNMWFVVGCFGLVARWLEKAQLQCLPASVASADRPSPVSTGWLLRNRGSLLLWLWCILQPICLVSSGWTQWTATVSAISNSQALSIAMLLAPSAILLLLIESIRISHSPRNGLIDTSLLRRLKLLRDEIGTTITATWFIPMSLPLMIAGIADFVALTIGFLPCQELLGVVVSAIAPAAIATFVIPHLFTRAVRAAPIDESIFYPCFLL